MLKTVLFYLLIAFTGIRFADTIYLLAREQNNLPSAVIILSSAMIAYGLFLIVKRFISGIKTRELMFFYLVQALTTAFNLIYVSMACPLKLSFFEIIAVGTFLDLLVDACVLYYCVKRLRHRPVSGIIRMRSESQAHV